MSSYDKQQMLSGQSHRPMDDELAFDRLNAKKLCRLLNTCRLEQIDNYLQQLLKNNLGRIEPPFLCDYGYNITIGELSFINYNAVMLDAGKITIGIGVMIGPNCSFYATTHHENTSDRLQFAIPVDITIENYAWLGGNVTVLPGITISEHAIVGAGSVVTKNIPAYEVWAGNPAKFIRKLTVT